MHLAMLSCRAFDHDLLNINQKFFSSTIWLGLYIVDRDFLLPNKIGIIQEIWRQNCRANPAV